MKTGLSYRPDIDGLRAVAVMGVVAFHAFPWLAPGGFAGVDIFFVISGFLITGIILRQLDAGAFSFADFYAHRVRRIFPALIVVLIAGWAIAWAVLAPGDYQSFAHSLLGGVGFYANFSAAHQDYFHALGANNLLLHLWSLGIEEQFYLLWPLLLVAIWRWARPWLPLALAISIAASFGDSIYRAFDNPIAAFYFPDSRFWELGLGGALALAMLREPALPLRARKFLSVAGILGLLGSLLFLDGRLIWPGWWALVPTLATMGLLASGPDCWANKRILSSRVMVAIGKVSYPWYLWHWPLIVAGRLTAWSLPQSVVDGIMAAASLGLAVATYVVVEKPIRFGLTGRIRTQGPIAAMFAPAALAGIVLAGKGFPERFPPDLRIILAAQDIRRSEDRQFHYSACFDSTQTVTPINPGKCVDPKMSAGDRRPLIFLWGDSHAYALYPGLLKLQQENPTFRLAFFAKGSCPFFAVPGRTWAVNGCSEFNDSVKAEIRRLNPDVIVVDSFWTDPQYKWNGAIDTRSIHDALMRLKTESRSKVIVVGTVPAWMSSEPTIVAREWRKDGGTIPKYAMSGLDPATFVAETRVRDAVGGTDAKYISLIDRLCTAKGCLLMADPKHLAPLQLDGWHLTTAGSVLVAHMILPTILADAH